MKQARVVFMPSGKRGTVEPGTTLLSAARALGVDIDSLCGGNGFCGRCQVQLVSGQFAKHGIESQSDHASSENAVEQRYRQKRNLPAPRRLACQARILGDLVVDVPPESQVYRQVIRKAVVDSPIPLKPAVTLVRVKVEPPDMHRPGGDLQRLRQALSQATGSAPEAFAFDFHLLGSLQNSLRQGEWQVTAALYETRQVIGLWPDAEPRIAGLAVDLGSTTVAAQLIDLVSGKTLASAGLMNPQIRYGEDVMSRVSYAMLNAGGAAEMTAAIRATLNELAASCAHDAGLSAADIVDLVLVGNPIMHHLLLGLDPVELGGAPFALASDEAITMEASKLDLLLHEGARAYLLPCIAGHVGADTAAVALDQAPDRRQEISFIADVGTNAEMLLGNRERLLAASSPTGPAFEGAQISSGQRAAPGAIERVRIDPDSLEPRFRLIGSEKWSDEAGFSDAVRQLGLNGICGSGIIEAVAELYLARIINQDGQFDGRKMADSPRIIKDGRTFAYRLHEGENGAPDILIRQSDVRAIQMAKAALYAGYRLLADKLELENGLNGTDRKPAPKLEAVALAGAFGSHIDVKYAMVLGLIPDCDLRQVTGVGNAAGAGARLALLNLDKRRHIEALVTRIEKIETAVEPLFQQHFVEAMALPHKTAPFSHLREAVALPEPFAIAEAEGAKRRRRRTE